MALEVKVYHLQQIINNNSEPDDVARIVQAITRTVEPASWTRLGGDGTVVAVKKEEAWRLVVLSEHQDAVRDLIVGIRVSNP